MDVKKKAAFEKLFRGVLPLGNTQEFLSRIDEDDISEIIKERDMVQLIEQYKSRNTYTSETPSDVPDPSKADLWNSIEKEMQHRPATDIFQQ